MTCKFLCRCAGSNVAFYTSGHHSASSCCHSPLDNRYPIPQTPHSQSNLQPGTTQTNTQTLPSGILKTLFQRRFKSEPWFVTVMAGLTDLLVTNQPTAGHVASLRGANGHDMWSDWMLQVRRDSPLPTPVDTSHSRCRCPLLNPHGHTQRCAHLNVHAPTHRAYSTIVSYFRAISPPHLRLHLHLHVFALLWFASVCAAH